MHRGRSSSGRPDASRLVCGNYRQSVETRLLRSYSLVQELCRHFRQIRHHQTRAGMHARPSSTVGSRQAVDRALVRHQRRHRERERRVDAAKPERGGHHRARARA